MDVKHVNVRKRNLMLTVVVAAAVVPVSKQQEAQADLKLVLSRVPSVQFPVFQLPLMMNQLKKILTLVGNPHSIHL